MADKIYKVNEAIEIGYQAPNKQSGQTVIAEIYDETGAKDGVNFPDVTMVEVGTTGTYRGSFTPDAQGTWQIIMHLDGGDGQVTKAYSVGAHNVDSVGNAVGTVDGKVDAVNTAIGVVDGKVDASEAAIRGADDDTLKTLSDQLDSIEGSVGALDTPPMAF